MPRPLFIPPAAWERLKENGKQAAFGGDGDVAPVVKLLTPDAQATWLLTEVDPVDTDRAFGLCDLGLGFPELGYVDLRELAALRGSLGLPVELDQASSRPDHCRRIWVKLARLGKLCRCLAYPFERGIQRMTRKAL